MNRHASYVEEELVKRRKDELKHAQDVRELYEHKLRRANNLFGELSHCMMELQQREQELLKRERRLFEVLNFVQVYGVPKKNARTKNQFLKPVLLRAGKRLIEGNHFTSNLIRLLSQKQYPFLNSLKLPFLK